MRVVGIEQLKARLSEYLREVRRGEVFLVTDGDEVIAELRPAKADWTWQPRGAGLSAADVGALLDELRADRFAGPG
jgi:antitoxin (DNA-binding transcriptional repressor) of toxin-antitoxin stability system